MTGEMRSLPLLVLLAAWAIVTGLLVSPVLGDAGGDTAQYMALAEALARGDGYVDTHLPGSPWHVHYPPGLALLFSAAVLVFGPAAFVPAKIAVLTLGVFGLYCFGRLFARLSTESRAVVVVGIGAFSVYFVRFGASLLSEMPAMGMLGGTLYYLDRACGDDRDGVEGRSARAATLAAVFAALGFTFRVANIVVMPALVWMLLRHFRWRGAWRVALAVLPPIGFFAWGYGVSHGMFGTTATQGTWSYGDEIAARIGGPMDVVLHAVAGIPHFVRGIGQSLLDWSFVARFDGLAYVLAAPALVGIVHAMFGGSALVERDASRWRRAPLAWTTVLGVGVACAAPERTIRYLVPYAPCFAFFFVEGVVAMFRWSIARSRVEGSQRVVSRLGLVAGALLATAHAPGLVQELRARITYPVVAAPPLLREQVAAVRTGDWSECRSLPEGGPIAMRFASWFQVLDLARRTTSEDAVLISRKPRFVSYLTGRRCLRLPAGLPPAELARRLESMTFDVFVDDGLFADTRAACAVVEQGLGYVEVGTVRSARLLKAPWSSAVEPGR